MLSSLWNQLIAGDDSSSDSSTKSQQQQQPPASSSSSAAASTFFSSSKHTHPQPHGRINHKKTSSSSIHYNHDINNSGTEVNYDDIAAERLLSSFPPFGTFSNNVNGGSHQLVSSADDDLSESSGGIGGGFGDDERNSEWDNFTPWRQQQQQQRQQEAHVLQRRKKNTIGTNTSTHSSAVISKSSFDNRMNNMMENDYATIDKKSYNTKTLMGTTTLDQSNENKQSLQSNISSNNNKNTKLIMRKNSIGEDFNLNDTIDENDNNNAWSDEEINIWYNDNNSTIRKNMSTRTRTCSSGKSYINTSSTNKRNKKMKKKINSHYSNNSNLRHRRQPKSSKRKKENEELNLYEDKEEIPSSIYWNVEFRQKWINSTQTTAPTTTPSSNNNSQEEQQRNNRSYDTDIFLDEDFSLIQAKKPSNVKIGKHFRFDFFDAEDENERLTESSYSGSFDYDDDDYEENEVEEVECYEGKQYYNEGNSNGLQIQNHSVVNVGVGVGGVTSSLSTLSASVNNNNISNDDGSSKNSITSKQHQQQIENDNKVVMKHYHEKSHWMPDQLCKHCYACGERFTVFRRRHHCRLCGQVFCNNCSSCFVEIVETNDEKDHHKADDGNSLSSSTTKGSANNGDAMSMSSRTVSIRTCKLCHEQVSSSGPNGLIWDGSIGQMEKKESISNLGIVENNKSKSNKINNSNASISQRLSGFQGGSTTSGGGEFNNLKMVKEKLESDRMKREELERSREEELLGNKEEENTVGLLTRTIGSTLTRGFGRLAESAAREQAQTLDTEYNDEETKLVEASVTNRDGEDNEDYHRKVKGTLLDKSHRPQTFEREVSDGYTVQSMIDEDKLLLEARNHLNDTAAIHLTKLAKDLLRTDAPLLLKEKKLVGSEGQKDLETWVNKLIALVSRCSSLVRPNVRNGDMLDIRPYCKIKVIPGGDLEDSTFVSGVIFHKNVSHKSMAKEILNPKLMLLNNSIEYTRENRILKLETLMEQETRYFQILITKISKMRPDILLVKGSVSGKAQELLMETNIVLVQNVKLELLTRISRQTGATMLSNTEHVMNQFDTSVLGRCRRFRLVSFLDNDIWNTRTDNISQELRLRKRHDAETIHKFIGNFYETEQIGSKLLGADLANHQRQAILAAGLLGGSHHDGSEVVQCGIAKRGVTVTYVMIEGCPSHLGCTVVLRGASRPALKQVKRIFHFLINVSYNLKLETSYLHTRRGKLPNGYKIPKTSVMSSSLCVDFGYPPQGRKIRPWNGGEKDITQRSISGRITAFDHQSILISSVWMAGKTQCCPAEVKGISYYSLQDVSLGQFLRDSCFNLTLKCQNPECKKSVLEHSLSFLHNDGLINITVEEMEDPIPSPTKIRKSIAPGGSDNNTSSSINPIATWTYCTPLKSVVTPLTFLDQDTFSFSFGKFLEVFFYNKTVELYTMQNNSSYCMQDSSTLYFGCGQLAARFTYERIQPFRVYLRQYLPFDNDYHNKFTVQELNEIMVTSTDLLEKFHKQIEVAAKETRMLYGSHANKPEYLQMVLSQLNEMDREVTLSSGILKDKIVSVTNTYNTDNQGNPYASDENRLYLQGAFAYYPWWCRRYLFVFVSAWNERLSAIGQALAAMKKLADASQKVNSVGRGDMNMVQTPIPNSDFDDVKDSMKRLKYLREYYASTLNINRIDPQSNNRRSEKRQTPDEVDDLDNDEEFHGEAPNDEEEELNYNFSEEIDADVLASRQRFSKTGDKKNTRKSPTNQRSKPPRRKSSLNNRSRDPHHPSYNRTRSQSPSQLQNKAKAVTAGGAMKSALSRFFNRTNTEHDPHIVDLGVLGLGRPKMAPGVGGVVIPVYDDQPSTIIAHSLASTDYASQFRHFAKAEMKGNDHRRRNRGDRDSTTIEDYFAGSNGMETHSSNVRPRSSQRRSASNPANLDGKKGIEKRMLMRNKTHIKHEFKDYDEKDNPIAKFICRSFWATQFQAVRQAFLKESSHEQQPVTYNNSTFGTNEIEKNYVRSLSASLNWAVSGGKSGASFSKTSDERFIVKCISRTELQMFLDCAPAYFEYLSKAFFHGLPSMLAKIVGVYEIGYYNRVTGKRTMEQVAVMQNIFYGRKISRVFDLKGKVRGRFAKQSSRQSDGKNNTQSKKQSKKKSVASSSDSDYSSDEDGNMGTSCRDSDYEEGVTYSAGQDEPSSGGATSSDTKPEIITLLDGDFLEFTGGRPLPLTDRAKAAFHMSILNDTLFLSIINVLDYSILVGIDEEKNELVVGIIDYMRQYDILKQMERVGKSIPMVVGSEAPTIIQPPLYKKRFINAMERYFMTVPNKWTAI